MLEYLEHHEGIVRTVRQFLVGVLLDGVADN